MKQGVSWWLIFRWECCKNSKSFVSIYADVIFLVIPRQSPQRHMNYQFSTKCWKQNPCIKNPSVSNILSFDFSILQKATSCLPLFFPPETFNGFDGAYRFNVKGLRNLLSLHRVAAQIQVISRGDSRILSPNSVLSFNWLIHLCLLFCDGKWPLNHHVGNMLYFFQPPN